MNFFNPKNEPIIIKIGISTVDIEGAKRNLKGEIGNRTFEQVKKTAQDFWEKQLEKIVIEDKSDDYKTNFYSSMYHVSIAPNLYQDVDGRYRGMDMKIHEAKDFDYYTVFSLWDKQCLKVYRLATMFVPSFPGSLGTMFKIISLRYDVRS